MGVGAAEPRPRGDRRASASLRSVAIGPPAGTSRGSPAGIIAGTDATARRAPLAERRFPRPAVLGAASNFPSRCRSRPAATRSPPHCATHQVVIVCGETGSGKTTQLPKIALAIGPRPRARRRPDRPHPAAPDRRLERRQAHRRGAEDAARRGRRLQGPLPGPALGRRQRQADDRRHPARRDAERPAAARLRHDHRRRGARAQPEHRLPARPPAPDPAAPARPEDHRHLGDDRRRALRQPLRVEGRPGAGDPGLGPALSGRDPLAAVRGEPRPRPRRRDLRRRRRALARHAERRGVAPPAPATCSSSCRASARSATRPSSCASTTRPASRCCRCSRASASSSRTRCSRRTARAASCSPPTSPRPRSPCPASATSSTPARRGSSATASAARSSSCRSSRSARRRRTSAPAAAAGSPTASASASTTRPTSPARPRFTEPEIVRSSLAGVILRMKSLNLGAVEDFPFLEAPPKRAIADGYQLLNELGATDDDNALTPIGRELAQAAARSARRPDDPRRRASARRCARCWSSPAR